MKVIDINLAKNKGKSTSAHSKKLEWLIRDFISQNGYGYYDDEIDKGVLKKLFQI